ncbi:equistatin-like [Mytilus trossulus]|uniref:equistatin-like n=1 Tax=Mytilus trossulus TaxID=6551 RepID=UPI003005349C
MNYFCIVTLFCLFFLDGTTSSYYPNKETACHRELRIYQQEPNVPGRRIPVCDSRGNYAHKQCSGSQCYCVLKNGTHIPGFYVNVWEAEQQTCYCAREQAEYKATGLIGKWFRCTNDGSYDSIQCTGPYCYCADQHGKKIGQSSAHITEMHSLNC